MKKILTNTIIMLVVIVGGYIIYDQVINDETTEEQNSNSVTVEVTNGNSNAETNSAVLINQAVTAENTNTNSSVQIETGNANGNANTNISQNTIVTAQTIDDSAIQLAAKQTGYCEALAPADWSFISNAESTGADLFSPDRSLHAGWGISAVYTSMYPEVESFLSAWLSYAFTGSFDSSGFTLGTAQEIYEGFIQREFTTSTGRQGIAIYKTYNFGDPTMYVVSVYMADAVSDQWTASGATPFSVALSLRCVSQLRPTTSSVDVSSSDPGSSSDNPEVSLSDRWTEAIMGYENVYSPSTGDHYEAPLNSLWETGPEGSGYYRTLPGGGYEKLERGFGDY